MIFQTKTSKPQTSADKLFAALKRAGKHGLYNYELQRVGGLSWHRRLGDLRAVGFVIRAQQVKKGIFKYFLELEKEYND